MNNILCHIISLSVLFSVHSFWPLPEVIELSKPETPPTEAFFSTTNEEAIPNTMVCDPAVDKMALEDLYYATGSNLNWNLAMPMSSWAGVTLNTQGCVSMLELSNTGMAGTLPNSIGNLEALQSLHLDNNALTGTIPLQIGNLVNLNILFLDNNQFFGTIPESIGYIPYLQTIFLDNNNLTGPIPESFQNLSNLLRFDFFNNHIDGIPDMSSLPLSPGKFRVYGNNLTFEDILPHIFPMDDDYAPQDSFFMTSYYTVYTGTYFEVDLGIDEDITTSQYKWYKDGNYYTTNNTNKLTFDPTDWDVAGAYNCVLTNPEAPLLTLYSRYIYINVECGESVADFTDTYCGDQNIIINNVTYNADNPTGTETILGGDVYGCDSTINVNLTFGGATTNYIDTTLCHGGSFFYNGITYDSTNTFTSILLDEPNADNCDSIVQINLSFYPPAVDSTMYMLCNGEYIVINGETYDINNQTGTEYINLPNGCDSIHYINLMFFDPAVHNINEELCTGQEIIVNGTVYDVDHPDGVEVLQGGSFHQCDSTIFINLTFTPPLTSTFDTTLCIGDFVIVNGTTYNQNNNTGQETLEDLSPTGCDSIVTVNVTYYPPAVGNVTDTLCTDEAIIINGNPYDIDNPTGAEIISGGSFHGCDSTIFINLNFYPLAENDYSPTICKGDFIVINGTTYDMGNDTGTEIIPDITQGSCDSIVNVALQFYPPSENYITGNYCNGQTITINGIDYDQYNFEDTVVLENASSKGCDSTIYINLNFTSAVAYDYYPKVCEGEEFEYNGTTYNVGNLSGTETLYNAGQGGCDSIVNVNLGFYTPSTNNIDTTLCPGDSIIVNNTVHNQDNPTFSYFLTGTNQHGCDSIINVAVSYYPVSEHYIYETLCIGQSIVVNNTTYDYNNQEGIEVIPTALCDSTVYIDLEFTQGLFTTIEDTLCPGESIVVNNNTYNEATPEGVEVFWSGSQAGCDSTVTINLSFHEPVVVDYNPWVCEEDQVIVNGTTYNIDLPTGTETLTGQSQHGCDSTVNIQLYFFEPEIGILDTTICPGDAFIYNNTTYNTTNFSGTETLENASQNTCDSIVQINVNFYPPPEHYITQTLCFGEKITVNGVCYDSENPEGVEVIQGGSTNGCDSTIYINLDFSNASIFPINDLLCFDDFIVVDDIVYDINNPTDTVLFPQGSASGCDSIVEINLQFYIPTPNMLNPVLCPGEVYEYNGISYNENNLTDTVALAGIGFAGCDSTVIILLEYLENSTASIEMWLCPGEEFGINNNIYNEENLSGQETLEDQAANGCDSIVDVLIYYYPVATSNFEENLCAGDTIFINGTAYHAGNLSGVEVFENTTHNNCDSTVYINLTPLPENITNINQTFCTGQSLTVNGVVYDEGNPFGTETMTDANGCDSIVNVMLAYSNQVINNITETYCPGESILVNNMLYDEDNPTGTETILMGSVSDCDSSIVVNLSFYYSDTTFIEQTLCPGDSIFVNNIVYNENNPTGTETLEGAAQYGCDSVVVIDLDFYTPIVNLLHFESCNGEPIEVNGEIYTEADPEGEQVLTAANGCDSTLIITVDFLQDGIHDINDTYCFGQSIVINGTTYHEDNPSGIEIIANGATNNCDSIININLTFNEFSQFDFIQTFCEEEEIDINGTLYNIGNPTGRDTLIGASTQGCDSIIVVDLTFENFTYSEITETLCPKDSIIVNGSTYNITTPNGEETLTGQNNCDSIVTINLSFYNPAEFNYAETICIGDSVTINGNVYNYENQNGTEILEGASVNLCDSTITVNLSFYDPAEFNYEETICKTDSVVINGTVYNYENQNGTELLENASINMCDSTIFINLSFYENGTNDYQPTLCSGDSVIINGTTYNQANPEGEEILSGADSNGCDSIVNISLDFYAEATFEYTQIFCSGDSVVINGTVYNAHNPSGTELLEGASYQGCDSTIFVNLNFGNAAIGELTANICTGQTYEIHGETFSTTGIHEIAVPGGSSSGCDSIVRLNLILVEPGDLPPAIAGPDATVCGNNYVLSTDEQEGVSGYWEIISGTGILENPELATTQITDINGTDLVITWTLSNELCPNYTSDSLTLYRMAGPTAVDDNFDFVSGNEPYFSFNVLSNDDIPAEEPYSIEMLSDPQEGSIESMGGGLYHFTIKENFGGDLDFSYKVCLEDCPNVCSEARVNMNITAIELPIDTTVNIPNGFTPNGDGVNEMFVIGDLVDHPDAFKDNELIVFNRWGNIVYQAKPYQNNWGGESRNGKTLPSGTYYYILNLDLANGVIYKGDVTIVR